jgi:hypothetical protein
MTISIDSYIIKDTDGKSYILPTYLDRIHEAMSFMKKVIYDDKLFYTTYTTAAGEPRRTVSSLGKHIKHLTHCSSIFSRGYKFSPLIEFFFEEYRKHSINSYPFPLRAPDHFDVAVFNDFVTTMRKNSKVCKLKKRVADWESKPKKNMKRIIDFEKQMFERYSRVMAIRLDLNYHKAIFDPADIDKIIAEVGQQHDHDQSDFLEGQDISASRVIEGRVALEEVQKDRKRLFANMKGKPSLFKHLIGTGWCIECGRSAGYHLHLVLFFDGSQVKKHEYYAQQIGDYWTSVITQGRGYFENCNRKKGKYGDSWAFGQIDHWETVKRGKLIAALEYFCKTSQMVQVVPYAGCQLFGCGFVSRLRKVRGGRPRIKGIAAPDSQCA